MLDSNPLVVGFDGGKKIIDLKTGAVRETKPGDYITKSLAISEIGKSSDAKRWKSFLNEIFLEDAQIVEWIRRWCGYILTGLTKEQILVFFYGQGRNGKSVLVKTLLDIMGDYGRSIASETLVSTKRNSQSASPDLARLAGARFVATQETEEGSRMAESLVKTMTGGDRILARFLNKDLFEFEPQFKLAISGNHQPIIRGNDYGVWRRIRLIPFLATFTEANDDKQLVEKVAAERPHIARWMVEAASDYLTTGLGPIPDRVANATSEYQEQMDTLGQWIAEECSLSDATKETPVDDLFQNYSYWCLESGLRKPTKQAFGRRMSERPGIQRVADGRGRRYRGVALVPFRDFLS
jgi:P4 family phage/plasmid primase-like protien